MPDAVRVIPGAEGFMPDADSVIPGVVRVLTNGVIGHLTAASVIPTRMSPLPADVSVMPAEVSVIAIRANVLPAGATLLPTGVNGFRAEVSVMPPATASEARLRP
jgi:hypothetical protein